MNPALPEEVVIVDVPELKVSAALEDSVVPKSIGVDAQEIVLDPKEIVLSFITEETIVEAVNAYPAVSKDPFVTDSEPIVNALPSAHPQLTPFTVIADESVTPFVVNVLPVAEPDKTIGELYILVISAVPPARLKLPCKIIVGVPSPAVQVTLLPAPGPFIVKSAHLTTAFVPIVTVYAALAVEDELSKITESAEVGTDAPPAPPEVADQLVVVVASHVPVPPTQ